MLTNMLDLCLRKLSIKLKCFSNLGAEWVEYYNEICYFDTSSKEPQRTGCGSLYAKSALGWARWNRASLLTSVVSEPHL